MFHSVFKSRSCNTPEIAWRLPVFLAVVCLALLAFQGSRGLYETTEGRYAECAREMAHGGDWLDPVLNGRPHWTKPPLTYVAIGGPYRIFGPSAWSARLYLIPCHLLAILSVWWLAFYVWQDRKTAGVCALVYGTSVLPLIATQTISTDYPLTTALAASQAFFWAAYRTRSKGAVYLLWVSMGVAFLIKGPPSLLVLPAMIRVGWRSKSRRAVSLFPLGALALYLCVALSWYVWEASRHDGLMAYWLRDEVVNRSFSDTYDRHPAFYENFIIYLPILVFGMFPWTGWLVARWKRLRAAVGPGWLFSDEARWLLWSLLIPIAVFFFSRSKLPLYVLPLAVPFAVGIGRLLVTGYREDVWFGRAARVTACATLVIFVIGKGVWSFCPSERDMGRLFRRLTEGYGVRDPARLAVLGEKPLNGLSFYYDHVLACVPYKDAEEWAGTVSEGTFLLFRQDAQKTVDRAFAGRAVQTFRLSKRWRLLGLVSGASLGENARPSEADSRKVLK